MRSSFCFTLHLLWDITFKQKLYNLPSRIHIICFMPLMTHWHQFALGGTQENIYKSNDVTVINIKLPFVTSVVKSYFTINVFPHIHIRLSFLGSLSKIDKYTLSYIFQYRIDVTVNFINIVPSICLWNIQGGGLEPLQGEQLKFRIRRL